jgi:hypothetical protein
MEDDYETIKQTLRNFRDCSDFCVNVDLHSS